MSESSIILVTGSNGQLGMELREISVQYPSYEFIFLDRTNGPITNSLLLDTLFEKYKPAYLVNCAAYTAVDKAEEEKDLAFEINGKSVGNIASLCNKYHTRLIHLSTDYVFNGQSTTPLKEENETEPINAYGESKLLGELLAQKNNPDTVIIRTSWVYSYYGKNFVKTMIRLMNERPGIQVVNDQTGSPTYAADLAESIMQIISGINWQAGIYHYSNEGIITWFEFAEEIKKLIASDCIIKAVGSEQYPTPAKRPAYSVMDKKKFTDTFQIPMKNWKTSLENCIRKINSKV